MNFEQDMLALTADEVQACIETRLRHGAGPAWNESQGEPVWAWLMSAFHYWRTQPRQLQAVDQCLTHLLPDLFASRNWRAAEAACDYLLALIGLQHRWHPTGAPSWPFLQWLQVPSEKVTDEHAKSMAAALRLMRVLGLVGPNWAVQNLKLVASKFKVDDEDRQGALYFLECWKAWAETQSGPSKALKLGTWFELLRHVQLMCTEPTYEPTLTLAVDWAFGRFNAKDVSEFSEFKTQLLLAILQVSGSRAQASAFGAVRTVLGGLPEIEHALQRSQAKLLTAIDLRDTAGGERRSTSWLQAA